MAAHQFAAASRRYTAAIGLNPRNASYQLGIAFCNWHLGNDNDTVRHLHEAIRLDPNLALAHSTLAMWYVIHGLSEAAERSSATAYKLAPQDIEVLTARANVLDQAGDSEAACQILARAQGVTNQRLALPY
jgi:Flp pilus assembly protein TadD